VNVVPTATSVKGRVPGPCAQGRALRHIARVPGLGRIATRFELRAFVSVVIPTFNRKGELQHTLRAVFAQRYPADCFEVIVVDNSSHDGTGEMLSAFAVPAGSRLRHVVKAPEGPGPARDHGARLAEGEFVLFLDSDVALDERWLDAAVRYSEAHPTVGFVGGKVLYAQRPEVLNSFGGELSRIGLGWDRDEGQPDEASLAERRCLWLPTAALFVRREEFLRLGGFDPRFFHAYEDSDLGWRAAVAGIGAAAIPELRAQHHVSAALEASSSQFVFHYCKNRLRSLLKNYGPAALTRWLPVYMAYAVVDALARPPRAAKLRALAWNLGHLSDTLRERRRVQSLRRTPDGSLEPLFSRRLFPPVPLRRRRRRGLAETDVPAKGEAPAPAEPSPQPVRKPQTG